MKKISIALLALAAISTAALANDTSNNRNNRDIRDTQDISGQFISQTAGTTLFSPAVSEAMIRKHKGLSQIGPSRAALLHEKNGTTDSGV